MHGMWREGNHFTALVQSGNILSELFKAIDAANDAVLVELGEAEPGKLLTILVKALAAAVERGVQVLLLLDGHGARHLAERDLRSISATGIALRCYRPLGRLNHGTQRMRSRRKLVMVDGRVAFVGGFAAQDSYFQAGFDVAVRVQGPVLADWMRLFSAQWESSRTRGSGSPGLVRGMQLPTGVDNGSPSGGLGRVVWSQGGSFPGPPQRSLLERICGARWRILIFTPNFAPPARVRRELFKALRRGVGVWLVVPGRQDAAVKSALPAADSRRYGAFLEAGARIFEFSTSFLEARTCVVDDWSRVGSTAVHSAAVSWVLDAVQEVDDAAFTEQLVDALAELLGACEEVFQAEPVSPRWRRALRRHQPT
ncbi:MAG TPA: phospholipase D-like domain-containing protein [Halomonas sp.]|nr:phospholipase D-like domain-containing protein [Halomonas sp.]